MSTYPYTLLSSIWFTSYAPMGRMIRSSVPHVAASPNWEGPGLSRSWIHFAEFLRTIGLTCVQKLWLFPQPSTSWLLCSAVFCIHLLTASLPAKSHRKNYNQAVAKSLVKWWSPLANSPSGFRPLRWHCHLAPTRGCWNPIRNLLQCWRVDTNHFWWNWGWFMKFMVRFATFFPTRFVAQKSDVSHQNEARFYSVSWVGRLQLLALLRNAGHWWPFFLKGLIIQGSPTLNRIFDCSQIGLSRQNSRWMWYVSWPGTSSTRWNLKKVCVNIWEPKLQWHFLPKPTDTKQKAHCSWLNPHYAHDFDSNLGACPGSECGPQIDLFKMSRAQFRCRALSGDLEQSRNFRDISEKVETEATQHADFFLPWYLGRWRCLMVRISPFNTRIAHQKKTRGLTQQTLFFYSFYLCFYHEVLEFLLIFENTNSKRVSTPESKTHGTVEFSTTWNSLSNCMGSDSTGWKRTDFLTNNAGGLGYSPGREHHGFASSRCTIRY